MVISGETAVGPVESWTTGEEFSAHLLQCRYASYFTLYVCQLVRIILRDKYFNWLSGIFRQVRDGHHGWTMVMKDDADQYELNGYDYVLDLISEVEVAPAFPFTQANFIVTTDRMDRSQTRRQEWDGL